jgi:hypothetical protein
MAETPASSPWPTFSNFLSEATAGQTPSLRAPMTARIGSSMFWFFVTVLGERPSRPWASQSSAACRTG